MSDLAPKNPFREVRERYGMSQEKWAHALGVSMGTIHKAEYGTARRHVYLLDVTREAGIDTSGMVRAFHEWLEARERGAAAELAEKVAEERALSRRIGGDMPPGWRAEAHGFQS